MPAPSPAPQTALQTAHPNNICTTNCTPPSTQPSISQITFPSLLEVRTPIAFSYQGNKTRHRVRPPTAGHAGDLLELKGVRDRAGTLRGLLAVRQRGPGAAGGALFGPNICVENHVPTGGVVDVLFWFSSCCASTPSCVAWFYLFFCTKQGSLDRKHGPLSCCQFLGSNPAPLFALYRTEPPAFSGQDNDNFGASAYCPSRRVAQRLANFTGLDLKAKRAGGSDLLIDRLLACLFVCFCAGVSLFV